MVVLSSPSHSLTCEQEHNVTVGRILAHNVGLQWTRYLTLLMTRLSAHNFEVVMQDRTRYNLCELPNAHGACIDYEWLCVFRHVLLQRYDAADRKHLRWSVLFAQVPECIRANAAHAAVTACARSTVLAFPDPGDQTLCVLKQV